MFRAREHDTKKEFQLLDKAAAEYGRNGKRLIAFTGLAAAAETEGFIQIHIEDDEVRFKNAQST